MKRPKSYWLRQIRESKRNARPQNVDGPVHEWLQRYHDVMSDYLVAHLAPNELSGWRIAYTALHEMLGAVWTGPTTHHAGTLEQNAWDSFQPLDYLSGPSWVFSLLPPNFDPALFLPHYLGFTQFVGEQRSLSPETLDRICAEWTVLLSDEVVAA